MTDPTASDPRVLRGIAHPVRRRILAELDATGPMRAADVAQALAIPANQASFHLRQLAKYGLVEEAPDAARDRRDRAWRAVAEEGLRLNITEFETTPEGKAAATVFRRSAASWGTYLVERAMGMHEPEPSAPAGDRRGRQVIDTALRLSDEERQEFTAELEALLDRWGKRTRGAGDGRRTYSLFLAFQDYPDR